MTETFVEAYVETLGQGQGRARESLAAVLLRDTAQQQGSDSEYEYTVMWAVGSLYGAGTESVRYDDASKLAII